MVYKELKQKGLYCMAAVTFDTLKFVEALGIPEPQARAFSTAVQEVA